ncbi:MAG TPA: hypothetical protein GX735_02490 [Firmicutes bacterium]|nr:hypothetical protein [Bacillota bacterium]
MAKYVIKQYHKGVPIAASVPYDTLQEAKHYRLRLVSHHPERDYRIYRVEGDKETLVSG